MKKIICLFTLLLTVTIASAQFVARMEVKEPIPGVCDNKNVYALLPGLTGQVEAKCPVTNEEILERLNKEVTFLHDKPKFRGEGMVSLIINCKGQLVQCEMDNKTKDSELDKQIVAVFNSLGEWKSGTYDIINVDSVVLMSFEIKKGKFISVN